MKIRILPIVLVILFLGLQEISAQAEMQVKKIRADVAAINKNIAGYKQTKKDVEEISLEGTEAVFYSSGADLKKTTARIYGESFNAVTEIYYNADMPIFIYEKLNKYDKPIGASKSPKIGNSEEKRIYMVDRQIVKILVGKKEIKPTDERFEELKKSFSDLSDKLFAAFKQ